jgi:hypothetical protein
LAVEAFGFPSSGGGGDFIQKGKVVLKIKIYHALH